MICMVSVRVVGEAGVLGGGLLVTVPRSEETALLRIYLNTHLRYYFTQRITIPHLHSST